MNPSTLLLDVGGQSCRALAVDDVEAAIHRETRERVAVADHGEYSERNADELAGALAEVVERICRDAAQADRPVARAALAVERGSVVCWNRLDGSALSPVISWRDRRQHRGLEPLAGQAREIKRRTGLRFSPYGGAGKLAWCLNNLESVQNAFEQDRLAFGPLGSFLLARMLEGRPLRTDPTLAQRTLLWSAEDRDWDAWLLERFGLPASALPRLVASRSRHGTMAGRGGSVPMELLMGDQNCVPFLDGTPRSDTLYINLGTGAFLLRPLDHPVADERFQLSVLATGTCTRWALEASVHGAASALAWLERTGARPIDHEHHPGLRERCSHPPLFANTVDGLGSPWWRPGPEPCFVDDSGDPDGRLLAVLESIAFLIRANFEAMSERLPPPRRIVLGGGLSRSTTLCELITDLLGMSAERLTSAEATALGLWCCLHGTALPRRHFESIGWRNHPGLEHRYRRWLGYMTFPS